MAKRFFTSESVTEGHPDKICDQISDAVLDAIIAEDPNARVACETTVTTGLVLVMGEISTKCYVDIPKVVRHTIREIGYDRAKYGFDCETCAVITSINEQSSDIAMGVNKSLEAKRMLGYIPEMPAIYDLLTVSEHLEFIRRAYRMEDDGYGQQLLERFKLWDKKDKLGKELSKGMLQKLSICCALVHKPKVMIFDEPMVGLDPHAIKELKLMFRELKAQGAAILISTHMIDSVEDYWDITHIMVNGSFAATKRNIPEETQSETLEELFFLITEGKKDDGGVIS
jgi:ABC-type Na+ transport system ATPase subunit NatA